MKNILNNKILKGIGKTIYVLLYIIIVLVLLIFYEKINYFIRIIYVK